MINLVDMELHIQEIQPYFYKYNKPFCMRKTYFFFLTIYFLYLIYYLGGYNRKEPTPGNHEWNLKKVDAILCGRNTK